MAVYPDIEVGDLVTADLLDSMLPKTYVKQSSTSRNTTTTLADDTELANIPLDVGTYWIEFYGFMTQATTTTQKLKGRWGFTGTWNNPDRNVIGPGQTQTAAPSVATEVNVAGAQAAGQDVVVSVSVTSVWASWRETAINVVVTAAGNLSYQWAQNSSSGNNTTLQAESGFLVRRIG